jgi:hypothetical protein
MFAILATVETHDVDVIVPIAALTEFFVADAGHQMARVLFANGEFGAVATDDIIVQEA